MRLLIPAALVERSTVVGAERHHLLKMRHMLHDYEGHHPEHLAKPIRVLKDIGCKLLIVTNAAGSLDENMLAGSLMVITDHINWSGFNPLIGKNDDNYGPRFSDMSDAYSKFYRDQFIEVANKKKSINFSGRVLHVLRAQF